jgi:hypothetical protein
MPAITRMVGIGVSFSAAITLGITLRPLFAPPASIESLRVHRAQHVEKLSAIIAQRRDVPRSAVTVHVLGQVMQRGTQVLGEGQVWEARREQIPPAALPHTQPLGSRGHGRG